MSALQAILWITDDVMLRDDILVPNPPPSIYCIGLALPLEVEWDDSCVPEFVSHIAKFRLDRLPKGSERVHYTLCSQPPKGFRWLAHGKTIRAERVRP